MPTYQPVALEIVALFGLVIAATSVNDDVTAFVCFFVSRQQLGTLDLPSALDVGFSFFLGDHLLMSS